jgi:hypothetical protein
LPAVRSHHLLLALLAALVLAAGPARAASPPPLVVGIADQKPAMFTDPLFTSLGISHARIAVAWDVLHVGWQRSDLDAWMAAAHAANVEPLVTFDHSRRPGRSKLLPRPAQLAHELRMLRRRYPFVRQFASWNEANYCGEKTCHRPQLVAAYYRALKRACRSCRILAAELLDEPGMTKWVKAFIHKARMQPHYWGLHNYLDANYLRTSGTRALLRATRGQIWFTETGGIVKRRNRSKVKFTESTRHAATATSWVFHKLVALNRRRITRVYLFHWNPSTRHDSWDSGLVDIHDHARPAYRVLARVLRALRLRGQSPQSHPRPS